MGSVLGGYHDLDMRVRVLASVLFVGILCLVAALERLQYQLRQTESSRWWASNGRDVLNLFSFGVISYGLHLLGFFGPLILLVGSLMIVLLTAAQGALGKGRGASIASVGMTLGVGLPALVVPHQLVALAQLGLDRLAP